MADETEDVEQVDVEEVDDENEADDEETSFASQVQAAVMGALVLPFVVVSPVLSAIPPAWKLYHKLNKWSAYQMQKAANAHTLANVRRSNGHEDVLPAAWVEGGEDDKDRTGWRIKGLGDKRYDSAVHGRTTTRYGKANMIHVNEDDTEQGTWAEAAIDNAFQLNREQYLFRDAQVNMITVENTAPNADGALADGGQQRRVRNVSLEHPGILHDTLIPLGSRNGYDGQVVSWTQYSTLKTEQSDQETIRAAKNNAWAAAKLDDIERGDLMKWALILGGIGLVLLFNTEIGAFIGGLSGGGGGGGAVGGALGTLAVLAKPGVR